jgi:hypothetical protein
MNLREAVSVTLLAWTGVLSFASGASAAGAATTAGTVAAAILPTGAQSGPATYYDFRADYPRNGFCEQQVFHRRLGMAEPINVFFSLTTFALGLVGVFRSKRTTMAFQFLYGLLAGYGLFAALYHATMENGFYRMKDVAISLLQSFIIVMLAHALYLYRVKSRGRESGGGYRWLVSAMTVVFTIYPAAVHVAGESSPNPWIAWMVFDFLWFIIVLELILIWWRRRTWPKTKPDDGVFRLVWSAIVLAVLAYGGWSLDKFLCSAKTPALAYLCPHSWWHLCMGLCFYQLITLCRFFSAHEYGFQPVLERFPAAWGRFSFPFVEWQSRREISALSWTKAPPAPATQPLGDPGTEQA